MSNFTQREIYVPPGGPPQTPGPSREIYQQMGEENIFKMAVQNYNFPAEHLAGFRTFLREFSGWMVNQA